LGDYEGFMLKLDIGEVILAVSVLTESISSGAASISVVTASISVPELCVSAPSKSISAVTASISLADYKRVIGKMVKSEWKMGSMYNEVLLCGLRNKNTVVLR